MSQHAAQITNDTLDLAPRVALQPASEETPTCRTCAADLSLDPASIDSMHRSAEGLIGYVRCPAGHLSIHRFAEAYAKPKPPQSVLDLRARRS